MTTKSIKKSIEIDLSEYYNSETGENLIEQISGKGISLSLKEDTNLVTLKQPDNFSFINLDTLIKLYDVLSNVELGYLFRLIPLTKTEFNIIFNHTIPHYNHFHLNSSNSYYKKIIYLTFLFVPCIRNQFQLLH